VLENIFIVFLNLAPPLFILLFILLHCIYFPPVCTSGLTVGLTVDLTSGLTVDLTSGLTVGLTSFSSFIAVLLYLKHYH